MKRDLWEPRSSLLACALYTVDNPQRESDQMKRMDAAGARETFSLEEFDLTDMIRCGRELRQAAPQSCMEAAAQEVTKYLRQALIGPNGLEECPLVRCFKTHPLQRLPLSLAEAARSALESSSAQAGSVPCLTLLGTSGARGLWNDRETSRAHRAIPLESVAVVERAPMIASLIQQMGLSVSDVLNPSADFLLDAEQRAFNVFHIQQAQGSRYVPAQDFVREHGISSVLGFGGLFPSGDLFAVILFSKCSISREVAERFRTIALSTKLLLLPFCRGPIFHEDIASYIPDEGPTLQERQRAEVATLQLLIPALEDVALQQTTKLQVALAEARQRTEEISHLNAVLESRVEERTAELLTANEELKAFSYSVSHDLQAPLRTIDGFAAALEEDCTALLDENGKGYLARIRKATVRMGQLIDAMLKLSRVTSAELCPSSVDLSSLALDIAAELRERVPGRTIQFQIAPDLRVEGDPQLLRAMMQNLLGNAVKFTALKPKSSIAFGWSDQQQAFFVRDDGEGFDIERADRLFQPFSRLHSAEDFPGTGVGLATVARIVRRHGGAVWATAAPGDGATFWFRLALGTPSST